MSKRKEITVIKIEELKNKFFSNPIMSIIIHKYPFRDYKYQFDLMIDWWINERKRLPGNIAAFENWIQRTKVDEEIKKGIKDKEEQRRWEEKEKYLLDGKAVDVASKLDEIKKNLISKMSI